MSNINDVIVAHAAAEKTREATREAVGQRALVIREAMAEGFSAVAIAKALSVSRQRVYDMAKR